MGLTIWWLRANALRDASMDAGNLATVLAEQTNRAIQSIDLLVSTLEEQVEASNVKTPQDFRRMMRDKNIHHILKERQALLSHVTFMGIVDRDGRLINSTNMWPVPPISMADREHFQYLKNNNYKGLYVSGPIVDRITGIATILFIKRVNSPDNAFLGTIAVAIGLSYFQNIYESIKSLEDIGFLFLR